MSTLDRPNNNNTTTDIIDQTNQKEIVSGKQSKR